ncbi:hypothetical protein SEHO0A_02880 [Salmonella enterica subsp. houtenae str. ATCC BAA-1581]|nr:hypothetical protein SEHO0A_02880 [Salmonella enterica subsp. houtenae str. ATCC BAA-1581]
MVLLIAGSVPTFHRIDLYEVIMNFILDIVKKTINSAVNMTLCIVKMTMR